MDMDHRRGLGRQVAGYIQGYTNGFTFATVHGAGHEVRQLDDQGLSTRLFFVGLGRHFKNLTHDTGARLPPGGRPCPLRRVPRGLRLEAVKMDVHALLAAKGGNGRNRFVD